MFSSLSHWPAAFEEISVAMPDTRLVASEMRSSATACVLRWIDRPSLTRVSKALPPSAWALEKAPRPASQICWAESLMAPDSGELAPAAALDAVVDFWIFLTMGRLRCGLTGSNGPSKPVTV
ncbi:hypothetical protein D9M70_640330 [compost metagenome]